MYRTIDTSVSSSYKSLLLYELEYKKKITGNSATSSMIQNQKIP
jgi:hypothetical protein